MSEPGLEPLSPSVIAGLLAATATTITAEMHALGENGGWRPATGEWSANECVGHLIEAERRGFAGRIRQILAADPPDSAALVAWDEVGVAVARQDHLRDGRDLAAEFASIRADTLALVTGLAPEDLARSGMHPEVGLLRVSDLLGEWVHHDRNHVRQMLAVTQDRVWDQMGNSRRFSEQEG